MVFFANMRQAATHGNFAAVRELTADYMGRRLNYGTNLPLAQLKISNIEKLITEHNGSIKNYKRSLDLKQVSVLLSGKAPHKAMNLKRKTAEIIFCHMLIGFWRFA